MGVIIHTYFVKQETAYEKDYHRIWISLLDLLL